MRSSQQEAPKNIAWSTDLFAGPGGLAERESTLEAFLATRVEGRPHSRCASLHPGAKAHGSRFPGKSVVIEREPLHGVCRCAGSTKTGLNDLPPVMDSTVMEPPLTGFDQIAPVTRFHRMEHAILGTRNDVSSEDVERLRREGWRFVLTNDDFLELCHLQAWYFQVRVFPRLRWIILDAPSGGHFIVGDRPVVWGFDGKVDAQPRALRHPDVQLFATLTRSVALFASHPAASAPRAISYRDVNRIVATAAQNWIAGPTRAVVAEVLSGEMNS